MDTEYRANARGNNVALIACACAAEIGLFLGPFIVGGVVETYSVSEGTAGIVYSIEVAGAAVAAALVAIFAGRLPARPTVVFALAALLLGNIGATLAQSLTLLMILRFIVGIGAGVLMSIANTLIAHTDRPHQTYTRLQFILIVGVMAAMMLVPFAVAAVGPAGIFVILATISFLAMPFAFAIPSSPVQFQGKIKLDFVLFTMPVLLMLLSVVALFAAQNGLWAYVERIGDSLDLSLSTISTILTVTTAFALIGPALAHWLDDRFSLVAVITAGIFVQMIAALVLVTSQGAMAYACGAIIYSTAFMFVIPYLKTALVRMDASGRAVGAMVAVGMLGTSAGPVILGTILDLTGEYSSLAVGASGGFILSMILVTLALKSQPMGARI